MAGERERILQVLREHGGEVRDPVDAVRKLQSLLLPRWEKRDSLVHLLLDMERDGLVQRERPNMRRTTAVRSLTDTDEIIGAILGNREEVLGRLAKLERMMLELQSTVLGLVKPTERP